MQEMGAKISISLLRYIGTIPADRAFYEAGMACKQVVLIEGISNEIVEKSFNVLILGFLL